VYRPHAQVGERIMMLVARGRGGTASAATALRNAVWQIDADQPLFRLESVEAFLVNRNAGERATTQVLGILAAIALVLAAVGTYGVMAYAAAQRVREIGIRLALGAARRDVFRLLLSGGLKLAAIGLLIGIPAAWGVSPLLRAVSAAVDSRDTVAFGGVGLLLAVVAVFASVVPAWRATRVDPASVLRDN
jgi:ABC-type antimicrobial peptide transport system permease subunit